MRGTTLMFALALFPATGAGAQGDETPPSVEDVRAWIQDLDHEDDAVVAERARRLTTAYDVARVELLRVFPHGKPKVRYWATRVLVDRLDPRNARLLEQLAETDHVPRVRILAVKGLQRLPAHELGPVLERCLVRDTDGANRKTLLHMIAVRRDVGAVETILDLIERSYDEEFVSRAYGALRTISGLALPNQLGPWRAWWAGRREGND